MLTMKKLLLIISISLLILSCQSNEMKKLNIEIYQTSAQGDQLSKKEPFVGEIVFCDSDGTSLFGLHWNRQRQNRTSSRRIKIFFIKSFWTNVNLDFLNF